MIAPSPELLLQIVLFKREVVSIISNIIYERYMREKQYIKHTKICYIVLISNCI